MFRFALLFGLLGLAAPCADAQLAFLPYGGYNLDAEGVIFGVGVEVGLPIAAPVALAIRPSAEYASGADLTINGRVFSQQLMQFNADVMATLGDGSLRPFVGAGVGVTNVALDTSDNDDVEGDLDSTSTHVGANLIAGANLGSFGPVQPFAQARITLADGSAFSLMGGLRIGL